MNFGHSGKSGKGGDFGKGYGKGMGKGSKGGKGFRENFEGNRYQRFNDMGKGTGFEDRGGHTTDTTGTQLAHAASTVA